MSQNARLDNILSINRSGVGRESAALHIIDTWLDYRIRTTNVPGYQICIRKSGEIIFKKSYGKADLVANTPMCNDHVFSLGSQSKMYTSCIILQMIESGLLSFDTKIVDILPVFLQHKDPKFSNITIELLLAHRAGLQRDCDGSIFDECDDTFNKDTSREGVISCVLNRPLIYEPSTVTKYSNLGYSLLGLIAEKVTGKHFTDLIEICIAARIPEAQFKASSLPLITKLATGYTEPRHNGKRMPLPFIRINGNMGTIGICANTENTSRFLHELLFGQALLGDEMKDLLHSISWPVLNAATQAYGYGLMHANLEEGSFIGHAGELPGYSTQAFHIKGTDYVIGFGMNSTEALAREIFGSVSKILVWLIKEFECGSECVLISPIMMNKWNAFIIIAGQEKAYYMPLDSWRPHKISSELTGSLENGYISSGYQGYWYVGETLSLLSDDGFDIAAVKWGSMVSRTERDFLSAYENITASAVAMAS